RDLPLATAVVPYSLRAKPRATVAAPIAWDEFDETAPDRFTIDDVERLLERPDTVLALEPLDAAPFVASVGAASEAAGLELSAAGGRRDPARCAAPAAGAAPRSLRRHAERAVEADDLAVEVRVVDDGAHERGVLLGLAQPRRVRDGGRERLARLLGQAGEHRRVEGAGRDRDHADARLRKVARGRQRHRRDTALRRGVGDLADLPVERRNARGVD